jgi:hypothetical protein
MAGPEQPRGAGPADPAGSARPPSRSERRDEAVRARLEPLREGERPPAVTVAAVAATVLALANLVALIVGLTGAGSRPGGSLVYQVLVVVVLAVAAAGMWRARYWAVLGMQALLGIQIIVGALVLLRAGGFNLLTAAVIVIVVASGALFWFLVKAMARLQMPTRP